MFVYCSYLYVSAPCESGMEEIFLQPDSIDKFVLTSSDDQNAEKAVTEILNIVATRDDENGKSAGIDIAPVNDMNVNLMELSYAVGGATSAETFVTTPDMGVISAGYTEVSVFQCQPVLYTNKIKHLYEFC